MSAGPFEWKQGPFSPKIRIEIDQASFSVNVNGETKITGFDEIEAVYISKIWVKPIIHSLSLEVVTKRSDSIHFWVSGYGAPNGFDAEECRKAVIAFLDQIENVRPGFKIYEGARPSRKSNLIFVGIFIMAFFYTSIQSLRETLDEQLLMTVGSLFLIMLIMAFLGWRGLRDINRPNLVSAQTAREALE